MSGSPPSLSETSMARIIRSIQELFEGRSNATGTVTLTANATSTVVTGLNIGAGSEIFLSPKTANASGALANVRVTTVNAGTFTLTHSNTATIDRTFGWVALG